MDGKRSGLLWLPIFYIHAEVFGQDRKSKAQSCNYLRCFASTSLMPWNLLRNSVLHKRLSYTTKSVSHELLFIWSENESKEGSIPYCLAAIMGSHLYFPSLIQAVARVSWLLWPWMTEGITVSIHPDNSSEVTLSCVPVGHLGFMFVDQFHSGQPLSNQHSVPIFQVYQQVICAIPKKTSI